MSLGSGKFLFDRRLAALIKAAEAMRQKAKKRHKLLKHLFAIFSMFFQLHNAILWFMFFFYTKFLKVTLSSAEHWLRLMYSFQK